MYINLHKFLKIISPSPNFRKKKKKKHWWSTGQHKPDPARPD